MYKKTNRSYVLPSDFRAVNQNHVQALPVCLSGEIKVPILIYTMPRAKKTKSLCCIAQSHLRNGATRVAVQSHQGLGSVFVFKLCQEAFNQS